ncbi:hypothetical protein [Moorena producens]|uniref:hypothetical protein n=1 Tax=Moorena producens TaxID=1155739 RepID=UPI001313E97A|nr:hypothetical protein [Moorena producens]
MGSETLGSGAFRPKTKLSGLLSSATFTAVPFCLLPFAFCLLPLTFCLLPIAYCLLPFSSNKELT